jgi:hypothetical protein
MQRDIIKKMFTVKHKVTYAYAAIPILPFIRAVASLFVMRAVALQIC